jgi:hypothetical protein
MIRAAAATVLASAVAIAAPTGAAGEDRVEHTRHWILPDQAKLQLAGNVGFLSPGVGWSWLGSRVEGDLFFGWVPASIGGDSIVSLTGKLTLAPWRLRPGSGWSVRPLTAALQLTYTFGHEYFLRLPDHYPHGYYSAATAIRTAVAVGASVGRPQWGLDELGVYAELVALDAMLGFWIANPRALGPADVLSLAVGVRAAF